MLSKPRYCLGLFTVTGLYLCNPSCVTVCDFTVTGLYLCYPGIINVCDCAVFAGPYFKMSAIEFAVPELYCLGVTVLSLSCVSVSDFGATELYICLCLLSCISVCDGFVTELYFCL